MGFKKIVGGASLLAGLGLGAAYMLDHAIPEAYETDQRRGAQVIYDTTGKIYVEDSPENMLRYLLKEDPHELRGAMSELEEKVQ